MKGLGTALITPFTKEGEVDYTALSKLIEHQIAGGADYLVLLGTTSEVPTLTHVEQDAIIDFAVKQVEGRVPMILGIGGNSTHAVVGRINELKEILSVEGWVVVTPFDVVPDEEIAHIPNTVEKYAYCMGKADRYEFLQASGQLYILENKWEPVIPLRDT